MADRSSDLARRRCYSAPETAPPSRDTLRARSPAVTARSRSGPYCLPRPEARRADRGWHCARIRTSGPSSSLVEPRHRRCRGNCGQSAIRLSMPCSESRFSPRASDIVGFGCRQPAVHKLRLARSMWFGPGLPCTGDNWGPSRAATCRCPYGSCSSRRAPGVLERGAQLRVRWVAVHGRVPPVGFHQRHEFRRAQQHSNSGSLA
jgi:hypothetical protein